MPCTSRYPQGTLGVVVTAALNCLLICKCWESSSAIPEGQEALSTAEWLLQTLIYILKVSVFTVVPRLRRKEGRPVRGQRGQKCEGLGVCCSLPGMSGGSVKAKCPLNWENPLADAYCVCGPCGANVTQLMPQHRKKGFHQPQGEAGTVHQGLVAVARPAVQHGWLQDLCWDPSYCRN